MTDRDGDDGDGLGVPLRLRISPSQDAGLRAVTEKTGKGRSDVVRRFITEGLERSAASGEIPPVQTPAPPGGISPEQLDEAVNRILERLGYLESEVPGRVEVVLRELLASPGASRAAGSAPSGRITPGPVVPEPAAPRPDPAEVAGKLEASLRAAQTSSELGQVAQAIEGATLSASLREKLYLVWMECEKAIRATRHPAAAIDHAQKLPFPGGEDPES